MRALVSKGVGGVILFGRTTDETTAKVECTGLETLVIRTEPVEGVGTQEQHDVATCVDFISAINAGGKGVVVSAPSLSSTGPVLAAYLIVTQRRLASEAIQIVRDRRPGSMGHVSRSSEHINFLLSLEWACAAKECTLLGLAWLRRHRGRLTHGDLLSQCLSYVLPKARWTRPALLCRLPSLCSTLRSFNPGGGVASASNSSHPCSSASSSPTSLAAADEVEEEEAAAAAASTERGAEEDQLPRPPLPSQQHLLLRKEKAMQQEALTLLVGGGGGDGGEGELTAKTAPTAAAAAAADTRYPFCSAQPVIGIGY